MQSLREPFTRWSLQPTEREIFGRMAHNLAQAVEDCEKLATTPLRGQRYDRLRTELKEVEDCANLAAQWREDARWLILGLEMAHVHSICGHWLRTYISPDERKIAQPLFVKLAEKLRWYQRGAERLKNRKTERVGLILPKPLPGPHRDTRPVQVPRLGTTSV